MSNNTITREQFLTLMREWGQAGSVELVEETLGAMGMAGQEAFTKQDVVNVMDGVTQVALKLLEKPAAVPGVDEASRIHMCELLGSLQAHALPLARLHPSDGSGA
jgi:hypothetical protein